MSAKEQGGYSALGNGFDTELSLLELREVYGAVALVEPPLPDRDELLAKLAAQARQRGWRL